MFTVTTGVAAAGTVSWTPDRDVLFIGCSLVDFSSGVGTFHFAIVSTRPDVTTGFWPQPALGTAPVVGSILAVVGNVVFANSQQKVPVRRSETIYVAFSAPAWMILYFDEFDS